MERRERATQRRPYTEKKKVRTTAPNKNASHAKVHFLLFIFIYRLPFHLPPLSPSCFPHNILPLAASLSDASTAALSGANASSYTCCESKIMPTFINCNGNAEPNPPSLPPSLPPSPPPPVKDEVDEARSFSCCSCSAAVAVAAYPTNERTRGVKLICTSVRP
jgi:hypothetical protein